MKDVICVACCCMVAVIVFGDVYNTLLPKDSVIRYVPCSYDIENMAKKINVTLMGKCLVER